MEKIKIMLVLAAVLFTLGLGSSEAAITGTASADKTTINASDDGIVTVTITAVATGGGTISYALVANSWNLGPAFGNDSLNQYMRNLQWSQGWEYLVGDYNMLNDSDGVITFGTTGWINGVYTILPRAWQVGGSILDYAWQGDALSFTIDRIAPSVSVGNDVLALPGDDVGLSAVASDNLTPSNLLTYVWTGATPDPDDPSKATVSVPEAYFDENITVTVTDAAGNSASDIVRVKEIASYIGSMLPPGLNKIMERGGTGK